MGRLKQGRWREISHGEKKDAEKRDDLVIVYSSCIKGMFIF